MILSFRDMATSDVYHGRSTRGPQRFPPEVVRIGARKLDVLHAAHDLRDLRSPPGNRLEKLSGRLRGFYSIRINRQWRVIFRWSPAEARDVQIVDYHSG